MRCGIARESRLFVIETKETERKLRVSTLSLTEFGFTASYCTFCWSGYSLHRTDPVA